MGLKINTTLHTPDGGTVNTGSVIKFDAGFMAGTYDVQYNMYIYRSQADYDAGKESIRRIDEFPLFHSQTFTATEYANLTPVLIHDELKAWMLDQLGTSDTAIVDIEL